MEIEPFTARLLVCQECRPDPAAFFAYSAQSDHGVKGTGTLLNTVKIFEKPDLMI